jgi:hypothetical protein
MTDSANNGWNGARMEVRQNGIVIATIGATYTAGAGPVDVPVMLCKNVPFDLYWSVAGTQPAQCVVAVINSFGQTLYTKNAAQSGVGLVVYNNIVNCDTPVCDIAPINVLIPTATITTTTASITWTAPATTLWDVYVMPAGTAAPTTATVPTYANVSTNPFGIFGLTPDTTYDVYVRVVCSPFPSGWSVIKSFTTLPTCFKPTASSVTAASITTTSATFNWTTAKPTDNSWEILLVPSLTFTPPCKSGYWRRDSIDSNNHTINISNLDINTCYYLFLLYKNSLFFKRQKHLVWTNSF